MSARSFEHEICDILTLSNNGILDQKEIEYFRDLVWHARDAEVAALRAALVDEWTPIYGTIAAEQKIAALNTLRSTPKGEPAEFGLIDEESYAIGRRQGMEHVLSVATPLVLYDKNGVGTREYVEGLHEGMRLVRARIEATLAASVQAVSEGNRDLGNQENAAELGFIGWWDANKEQLRRDYQADGFASLSGYMMAAWNAARSAALNEHPTESREQARRLTEAIGKVVRFDRHNMATFSMAETDDLRAILAEVSENEKEDSHA